MGKLLSLGTKLKYPITITKLYKQAGDRINKQQAILEYKWTWKNEVGDPTINFTWTEDQTSFGDWDSPVDGNIKSWKVHVGQVIEGDRKFVEVDEDCPHSVQFQGLCGMCGKDMTEVGWASPSDDTSRATINMIHDQTSLKVSEDEASKAEEELQRRLLKHRKLSLVVDLDQTIIHACIEPTVGEWRDDPTSPNYEAVKDVKSFQLNDDGPRGAASGCWYYIKMRPGLAEFLAKVSEMYELHVYTMGTRAYALNIAKIVDPDKKLFGDRIISRDENGNVTAKSLSRLFPVDTKMVVIIDDRADVWPRNRPNLIKVVPYDFFLGIGDINSSFLPKREELPKLTPAPKKKQSEKTEEQASEVTEAVGMPTRDILISTGDEPAEATIEESKEESAADGTRVSAFEELVRMGGGDDQALRLEQAAEQEKFLEKQLKERPLLHLQEKLDQKDDEVALSDTNNGDVPHEHHRHNLLKDDDDELMHLEQHLSQLHKAFYDEYDGAIGSARGGRVAQLKPGVVKKLSIKDVSASLKIVPDIGIVMPRLKSKTFEGCVIVTSGLVPLNVDIERYLRNLPYIFTTCFKCIRKLKRTRKIFGGGFANPRLSRAIRSEIGMQVQSFGANLQKKVSRRITHLVAPTSRTRTNKVKQAAKYPNVKIVNLEWLLDSMSRWEKQEEEKYLVQIHESDRRHSGGNNSSLPSSIHDSDESSDDSGSGSEGEEEDAEDVPGSQEESFDEEGVMPDDVEPGHSPVDDLKTFDWNEIDDELKDFLDSDSSNDSDAGSVASDSSRVSGKSNGSVNGRGGDRKRKLDETTDDEESDDGSKLSKKQRIAHSRSTGLKKIKMPNSGLSESSLPTPAVTGDEAGEYGAVRSPAGDDGDNDDDGFDDDLEADLMAEFDREEAEAQAASDGAG